MPTKHRRSTFPRSTNEAFPNTAEYACSIERPAHSPVLAHEWAILACAVASAIVLLVWG